MILLILEALLALLILVGIVWWTMFSGRSKGELPSQKSNRKDASRNESDGD
jgi:cytoskeletal protein RodZ